MKMMFESFQAQHKLKNGTVGPFKLSKCLRFVSLKAYLSMPPIHDSLHGGSNASLQGDLLVLHPVIIRLIEEYSLEERNRSK